jgi:hypothetical protein
MLYASHVRNTLYKIINKLADNKDVYCTNPGKDFTRNRKIGFRDLLQLIITMEGGTINSELLKYFEYDQNVATASAFIQQRSKLKEKLFSDLFYTFNDSFPYKKRFKGYRLIACDGTDLIIYNNPEDYTTYYQTKPDRRGFNMMHLDACYDLCNRRYTDVEINPGMRFSETGSMVKMLDRYKGTKKTIFIADRGFEAYNVIAHAIKNKLKFLIRIKDNGSNGMYNGFLFDLPDCNEFDVEIHKIFTSSTASFHKGNREKYKYVNKRCIDFFSSEKDFKMDFRIVRFAIAKNKYECVVTNLSKSEFNQLAIKDLYHMRWGIETSFRELKYAIGLTSFHSKKVNLIRQEIYARITMYNFCELITTHTIVTKSSGKYEYHVNYTMAISLCRRFLRQVYGSPPINVEKLLQRYLQPFRPSRKDSRKEIKNQPAVSFVYRVAA